VVTRVQCANEAELSQFLGSNTRPLRVRIGKSGHTDDELHYTAEGVIEHSDVDQVVVVHSGTTFAELKRELAKHGQVLPFVEAVKRGHRVRADKSSIGQVAAMGIPHPGEGLVGGFRDWVLGLTVVLADGTVVKCGSKAVKSVAGYDVQKLFLGARHTLGVITQFTFKTYPAASFDRLRFDWTYGEGAGPEEDVWIQRTHRSDFAEAVQAAGASLSVADRGSSTLWCYLHGGPQKRFAGDWVLRPNVVDSPEAPNDDAKAVMSHIKNVLDPEGRLNPGGLGFL